MFDPENPEILFALDAARQAGLLVSEIQSELAGASLTKEDRSPVTAADFAAQAIVARRLSLAFPDARLVGEEESAQIDSALLDQISRFVKHYDSAATPTAVRQWIDLGKVEASGRFWTLDPIDGTKGFLRGEQYAVALALIEDGQVQIGVLACPNLERGSKEVYGGQGSLVLAAKGKGAWTMPLRQPGDFETLKVSELEDPANARLLRSFEAGHTNVSQLDLVAAKLGTTAEPLRLDSQAKYALLAAGSAELLFRLISPRMPDYREKIWDQAAGSLICQEAGGKVTDLDGKALDFTCGRTLANNRGVLASNGRLHQSALEAIRLQGA